jgi:hypothetical protein
MNYPYFDLCFDLCPIIDDRMPIATVLFLKTRIQIRNREPLPMENRGFSPLRIADTYILTVDRL